MRGVPPRHVEIDTLERLRQVLDAGHTLSGRVLQSLDLVGWTPKLISAGVRGAFVLGCHLDNGSEDRLRDHGALVFPRIDEVPFNPYRPTLYSAEELYGDLSRHRYATSFDAVAYAWSQGLEAGDLTTTLAASLHDHAISDALDEWCAASARQATVGIMGGHAAQRGSVEYSEAARLAAGLSGSGFAVMTGGGPGAMEAANLGARLADRPDDLHAAIDVLSKVPTFQPRKEGGHGVTAWARAAFEVLERWPGTGVSLGVPTWFYGHEPPNVFATAIAKFFSNAQREDILLKRCRAGIVYLPGAAGTVQEIFQAATGVYYAADESRLVPLVLVGRDHWTTQLPAWPLLSALGTQRPMGRVIHCVDGIDEALEVLGTP